MRVPVDLFMLKNIYEMRFRLDLFAGNLASWIALFTSNDSKIKTAKMSNMHAFAFHTYQFQLKPINAVNPYKKTSLEKLVHSKFKHWQNKRLFASLLESNYLNLRREKLRKNMFDWNTFRTKF